ncbi:MAG: ZIP family metal transporter [Actinomycetota bacterium]|nr:ZIP family metal transporter [Actinomycetota bacterium]
MLEVLAAATVTAVATSLGVLPVWALGSDAERWRPVLTGFAAGAMGVAAVAGLFLPALERGTTAEVVGGCIAGMAFLFATRAVLGARKELGAGGRSAALIFAVLLVHSLPEGFAIGTAYASEEAGLGLFVVIAIALQNVPEGTGVALPLAARGVSLSRQAWLAFLTCVPQPIGAVVAFLLVEEIEGLLPVSFGFAAGAMALLVVMELGPSREARPGWAAGGVAGAAIMLALGIAVGI